MLQLLPEDFTKNVTTRPVKNRVKSNQHIACTTDLPALTTKDSPHLASDQNSNLIEGSDRAIRASADGNEAATHHQLDLILRSLLHIRKNHNVAVVRHSYTVRSGG